MPKNPCTSEDNAVKTNDYDITNAIVDQRMKTYVVYSAEEHDQTRRAVKELECTVLKQSPKRIWLVVDSVATKAAIFIILMLVLSGC